MKHDIIQGLKYGLVLILVIWAIVAVVIIVDPQLPKGAGYVIGFLSMALGRAIANWIVPWQ